MVHKTTQMDKSLRKGCLHEGGLVITDSPWHFPRQELSKTRTFSPLYLKVQNVAAPSI